MANQSKQGPLTAEDLLAIWQGGTDSAYVDPYLAAGDGNGLEVHSQSFAQGARVSLAVDRTFQSMYVLPWSGQTGEPASGARWATCAVTLQRAGRLGDALVLEAGRVWVDEEALDASTSGPVRVPTGRRYLLQETVVFFPGEQGPFDALVEAEKPGASYNDAAPGSLIEIEQPGSTRNNVLATVTFSPAPLPPALPVPAQAVVLTGDDAPDMFTPDQLGQYVGFVAGANAGLSGRVVGFYPPTPTAGSGVRLEQLASVLLAATGSFVVGGAPVTIADGATVVGSGTVLAARATTGGYGVALSLASGTTALLPGYTLTQALPSGTATGTVAFVHGGGQYAPEAPGGVGPTGGASWRMLAWDADWRLSVTNAASPAGGAVAMLDALGKEKKLPRLAGEQDPQYAQRITRIADVVTPNALRRALVRNVGATGWCLREVGYQGLPGLYFDRKDAGGDWTDIGVIVFSGTYASTPLPWEKCQYIRDYVNGGVDVLAEGYWGQHTQSTTVVNTGGYAPATYLSPRTTSAFGEEFGLVLAPGRFSYPLPQITPAAGDRIVGVVSKATFAPQTQVETVLDALRFHCLLSYADMRAFFLAGAPAQGFGEFGFAYDMPAAPFGQVVGAWDAGPGWLNFFDGFPAGNKAYYQRLFNDLDRVRAGGVGFELFETRGQPCT